jgi:hypothetical protein
MASESQSFTTRVLELERMVVVVQGSERNRSYFVQDSTRSQRRLSAEEMARTKTFFVRTSGR